MKKSIKIKITKYVGENKKIEEKELMVCGYCESRNVYRIKSENALYCRKCGRKSKLPE